METVVPYDWEMQCVKIRWAHLIAIAHTGFATTLLWVVLVSIYISDIILILEFSCLYYAITGIIFL